MNKQLKNARNKMRRFTNMLLFGLLLSLGLMAHAQELKDDDFDVIVIPIARSSNAPGKSFNAATLADRGLNVMPVKVGEDELLLPNYQLGFDSLMVTLNAGEGIQFWAAGIPLSSTQGFVTSLVSVQGEAPQQVAMAIMDANDPGQIGVSLSLNKDIPFRKRDVSMEFEGTTSDVWFLIQLVGPQQGKSVVTLERLRFVNGYRELTMALGETAVTAVEYFGFGLGGVTINQPPSNANGWMKLYEEDNHVRFPQANHHSLQLGSDSVEGVVQVRIPLRLVNPMKRIPEPVRYEARVFVKRLTGEAYGESGVVSLGLFSGGTGSGTYRDYPLRVVPSDEWLEIKASAQFSGALPEELILIMQLRGGPAALLIDDISVHTRRDSIHYWDSSVLKHK